MAFTPTHARELWRQLLHVAQIWVVPVVPLLGLESTLAIVGILLVVWFVMDRLSYVWRLLPAKTSLWQQWVTRIVTRERETLRWSGATYLLVGIVATLTLALGAVRLGAASEAAAITAVQISLVMMIIGDSLATLIGPSLAGPSIRHGRHYSGAFGFIIAALLAWLFLPLSLPVALLIGVIAAVAELATPRSWDDNVTIPVACFVAMLVIV